LCIASETPLYAVQIYDPENQLFAFMYTAQHKNKSPLSHPVLLSLMFWKVDGMITVFHLSNN